MWKPCTSHSNLFKRTNCIQNIISLSIYKYVPSNINIYIIVCIPSEVPSFSNKKRIHLPKNYPQLTNIVLGIIIFYAQFIKYFASNSMCIFISTHFNHEITKVTRGYIKPPYLDLLHSYYKKLFPKLMLLGNVISMHAAYSFLFTYIRRISWN